MYICGVQFAGPHIELLPCLARMENQVGLRYSLSPEPLKLNDLLSLGVDLAWVV